MGPVGPMEFPGRDGLSTTVGPLASTGLGVPPIFNANLSTIGMENSLHYLGELLNHVMQFQQNVNQNMVEHLNMTVRNQELQGQALGQLVENTRQWEFDKVFDSIPIYDGENPEKFEPWLSQLESACIVGKRDVREVAIFSSTGPVLEVALMIEKTGQLTEMSCVVASPLIKQEYMPLTCSVISGVSMLMKTYDRSYTSILKCIDKPLG